MTPYLTGDEIDAIVCLLLEHIDRREAAGSTIDPALRRHMVQIFSMLAVLTAGS